MDVDSDEPQTSQPAASSPTERIRDKNRQCTQQHREEQRAKSADTIRFGLGEIQSEIEEYDEISEHDIISIITRLARRKHASAEEMHKLSQAFIESMYNIELFLAAPFGFQVIVKEITGIDSTHEVAALECLCNLSLGDTPICENIVDMSGSILVAHLDSFDERIKRTTIWTLTNIISTSRRAAQTLVQCDIIPKLFYIYVDKSGDENIEKEFREDAAVCLQLLVMGKDRAARKKDIIFIKDNMIKKCRKTIGAEYHLKIIFDADIINPSNEFNIEQTHHLMDFILGNLYKTPDFEIISNRLRIVYAIRVLSNMVQCVPTTISVMKRLLLVVWKAQLEDLLNKVFRFGENILSLEVIYLIRNLMNDESEQPLPCQLDRLRVPNIDYAKLLEKNVIIKAGF